MKNKSPDIERIENKDVYFVRVKAELYEKIIELAAEDERTIHWTVNKLLEKQLETNGIR